MLRLCPDTARAVLFPFCDVDIKDTKKKSAALTFSYESVEHTGEILRIGLNNIVLNSHPYKTNLFTLIFLVKTGRVTVTIDGIRYDCKSGDFFTLSSQYKFHVASNKSDLEAVLLSIQPRAIPEIDLVMANTRSLVAKIGWDTVIKIAKMNGGAAFLSDHIFSSQQRQLPVHQRILSQYLTNIQKGDLQITQLAEDLQVSSAAVSKLAHQNRYSVNKALKRLKILQKDHQFEKVAGFERACDDTTL